MHHEIAPSDWIARWRALVRPDAEALDLACGRGRHARWLASLGCRVTALDRDAEALASLRKLPGIDVLEFDLEQGIWPFSPAAFDVIVVSRYLHRPLMPDLLSALRDDGVLIYETFMVGNEAYGRPANPDFLLRADELLDWARPRLRVVAFEQGKVADPQPAMVQRICAVGSRFDITCARLG
jgi:SAM-dependent methyltransferase